MAIPDYQEFMLPLLRAISDGTQYHIREVTQQLASALGMTEEERRQMLPSGQQSVVGNRMGWAKTYLKKAGLLENPKRGYVQITEEGRAALSGHPSRIDTDFLKRYPEFIEF